MIDRLIYLVIDDLVTALIPLADHSIDRQLNRSPDHEIDHELTTSLDRQIPPAQSIYGCCPNPCDWLD